MPPNPRWTTLWRILKFISSKLFTIKHQNLYVFLKETDRILTRYLSNTDYVQGMFRSSQGANKLPPHKESEALVRSSMNYEKNVTPHNRHLSNGLTVKESGLGPWKQPWKGLGTIKKKNDHEQLGYFAIFFSFEDPYQVNLTQT